jgi:hypothetical protein
VALNNTAKNVGLDAIAAVIGFISLHTDVVGSGSGGEVTGGSPAYARKAATWAAASAGSVALSNSPVFDVPATTVARAGLWSTGTGGTFYGDAELTDEVFAGQGTYTITGGTISITG